MDEQVDRTKPGHRPGPQWGETEVTRAPRWRGRIIGIVLLVVGIGVGWYLWTHHTKNQASRAANQTPPQPVGAATIDKGDIRIILNELGTVTSLDNVTVQTQINGQLTQVGFQEGQTVRKGDFLAQIDPRPYQAALEQAQGTLAHDQGLLQQAQSDLKRYQTLGRQDSIAQQQLEDQKYLVAQYTGTVQTDQGTVDNAKLNLAYCHIISPIDGQVGLRQVDPGNYVQTSSTTGLVVITQMQPISVLFSVPEDNLPDIIARVRSGATLSVAAYDRANTRQLATGQLSTLDNQIDTTTGTVKLRAVFANPDELLYPNQFVNARLLVNTLQNTVRVPVQAVQRGEPGTYVYVVNANNTVSVRPVKLGPTDGGYEAVTSGLQPGEKVVTDGTDRLRDGAPITIPPPAPAATQSANGQTAGTPGAAPGAGTKGQGHGQGQGHSASAAAGGTPDQSGHLGAPGQAPPLGQPNSPSAQSQMARPQSGEPPAVQPPSGQSPSAQPPFAQPPTGQPPTGQPPTGQPPTGQPSSAQPPAAQPRSAQPPPGPPPSAQPLTAQPQSAQPPAAQPHTARPQSGQPPSGQPPSGQPPSGQPPAEFSAPPKQ